MRSVKIGTKREFDGEVVGYMGSAYHVQDADGLLWHRERNEWEVIE